MLNDLAAQVDRLRREPRNAVGVAIAAEIAIAITTPEKHPPHVFDEKTEPPHR